MNNAPMTKPQRFASMLRPSRVCQILLIALTLKVGVLGGLAYESLFSGKPMDLAGVAHAADAPGAPAAPLNIQSPLTDANLAEIEAQARSGNVEKKQDAERTLPAIGTRRGVGAGNVQENAAATEAPSGGLSRDALVQRQDELSRKEEELKILEQEISQKIEQLNVLETRMQMMMREAEGTRDEKLRHLVDVLANMKSRQAAAVLETLELRTGVKILANMRGRQAGEILTHVNPEKAASLAEALSRMQMPLE